MGRVLKTGQCPKRFSTDISINEILYIVINCVIRHRSFHNVVIMGFAMTARRYEVQPFLRHFGENEHSQRRVWGIFILVDASFSREAHSPSNRLRIESGGVKTKIEIFVKPRDADLGRLHDNWAAVIEQHFVRHLPRDARSGWTPRFLRLSYHREGKRSRGSKIPALRGKPGRGVEIRHGHLVKRKYRYQVVLSSQQTNHKQNT